VRRKACYVVAIVGPGGVTAGLARVGWGWGRRQSIDDGAGIGRRDAVVGGVLRTAEQNVARARSLAD
jgi:hypothetical protein